MAAAGAIAQARSGLTVCECAQIALGEGRAGAWLQPPPLQPLPGSRDPIGATVGGFARRCAGRGGPERDRGARKRWQRLLGAWYFGQRELLYCFNGSVTPVRAAGDRQREPTLFRHARHASRAYVDWRTHLRLVLHPCSHDVGRQLPAASPAKRRARGLRRYGGPARIHGARVQQLPRPLPAEHPWLPNADLTSSGPET